MSQAATVMASADLRLDSSVESLSHLADRLDEATLQDPQMQRQCAAYFGEVLLRAAPGGHWVMAPKQMVEQSEEPALQWGRWFVDPHARIRHYCMEHHPDDTLAGSAAELIQYALDPTDDTATRLGWTRRPSTPWREWAQKVTRLLAGAHRRR